jgi:hypothetical protein
MQICGLDQIPRKEAKVIGWDLIPFPKMNGKFEKASISNLDHLCFGAISGQEMI